MKKKKKIIIKVYRNWLRWMKAVVVGWDMLVCLKGWKLVWSVLSFLRISTTSLRGNDGKFYFDKRKSCLSLSLNSTLPSFFILLLNPPVFLPISTFLRSLSGTLPLQSGVIIPLPLWVLKYFPCYKLRNGNY